MQKLVVPFVGVCVWLSLATPRPLAQSNGLVASFGFEEPTGTLVSDSSGLGNHGTLAGATRTGVGRFGSALAFDGVNDWVTVASSASLHLTSGFTVEAWVLPSKAGGWQTVLLKEATGGLRYALYESSDDGLPSGYVRVGSSDRSVDGPAALPLNAWRHLAVTYDRTNLRLYVNGIQASTRPVSGSVATSTGALRIGGNNVWGEYFQGTLDEIRIYNRALSAAEINIDQSTPITSPATRLVITAPAANATVSGPAVNVTYTTSGTLTGEEDHVHFVLDGATVMDPPPMDGSFQFQSVSPGVHVLSGYLARSNHSQISGTNADPVEFAVTGPDLTPPTVAQTSPVSLATNVPSSAVMTAIFTEALSASTVSGTTVVLRDAFAQTVSSTVSYDPSTLRVTLTPSSPLAPSASYTTTLIGGPGGISDVAGNRLESHYNWTFSTAAPPPPQPSGLVAAYGFEEGTGTSVADASGRGNAGTVTGATWTSAGRFGSALTFNGTSNWITVADAASLDLASGMTLEAWAYPTALSGWRTVLLKETTGNLVYGLYGNDNATRPAAYINNGSSSDPSIAGSSGLSLNSWTHLATTYDGTSLRLFVNGIQTASASVTGPIINSAGVLRIGGNAVWGEYFQGQLDEVRIYNRALTTAEIQQDLGTPVASSGLNDTVAPTVSITSPLGGTSVSGTTTVTATASDNISVAGVQFLLDNAPLGTEDIAAPFSTNWNTSGTANGLHTLTAIARDGSGNTGTSPPIQVTVGNTVTLADVGAWSSPVELGIVAVNMVLMHTGNVLMYGGENHGGLTATVWDPRTLALRAVPNTATNVFCSGHSQLADGRILVAGGHDNLGGILGAQDANIFNPVTETWARVPDMSQRRWYPTSTTLPDGRALVTSGGTSCFTCIADIPEVYNPSANSWTRLTAARFAFPYYPFMFVLPDGRVLNAGAGENPFATWTLDVPSQTWTLIDGNVVDGGSAAMYRPGRILKTGTSATTETGNTAAARTAYVLDMTASVPAWRQVSPMAFPRAYHNLTILPDGDVLVTGGARTIEGKSTTNAVYDAELWSPATETFRSMAPMSVPRLYHGTALLLPDGRVVVAGSGDSYGGPNQTTAQFYSPPYLFKGPRPTIAGAPTTIAIGQAFSVDSPEADSISSVSLIRLGAVTHQFDEDQRYVPLSFTRTRTTLILEAPANANLAPPGYYMLFLVNNLGVPSAAAIVQVLPVGSDSTPPTPPGALIAAGAVGRIDLTWSASADDTGVGRYNVHRATTSGFVPSSTNRIAQVTGTTHVDASAGSFTQFYRVTAEDTAGNISTPSNQAAATALQDNVPPAVSITSPADGVSITGTFLLQAAATDDTAVAGVRFRIDGVDAGPEDLSAPFQLSWNSATSSNGQHTVAAIARDNAGNSTTSTGVVINVSNSQPSIAGLVAAFGFDEGSGSAASDASGRGHVALLSGATWTPLGKFGGALAFDGASAVLTVGDAPDFDMTAGLTLEAWVYPTALSGWRTVVMKERPGGFAYTLYAHDQAPRPAAYVNNGGGDISAAGGGALPLNTWTHLTSTHDGTRVRLFINGLEVASAAAAGPLLVTDGALRIGGNAIWGEYFQGRIDEVRIYSRALSASEIQAAMTTRASGG